MRSASAPAKLRLPTLPQYMRKMIVMRDTVDRLLVMPVDMPTVATAEVVSNMTSATGKPSAAHMITEETSSNERLVTNTAVAFSSISAPMRLPNIPKLLFFRMYENPKSKRVMKVVVFMPPAVEPG